MADEFSDSAEQDEVLDATPPQTDEAPRERKVRKDKGKPRGPRRAQPAEPEEFDAVARQITQAEEARRSPVKEFRAATAKEVRRYFNRIGRVGYRALDAKLEHEADGTPKRDKDGIGYFRGPDADLAADLDALVIEAADEATGTIARGGIVAIVSWIIAAAMFVAAVIVRRITRKRALEEAKAQQRRTDANLTASVTNIHGGKAG